MGYFLGIDTSERIPNITVMEGEDVVLKERIEKDMHEDIPYFLSSFGISPEEIEGVGVAIGPGSFTGLRVGLSFAKAISFSMGIPLKGIVTLEAMVASAEKDGVLFPMIYARRETIFCGKYRKEGGRIDEILPPSVKRIDEVKEEKNIFGSGYEKYREFFGERGEVKYFTSYGVALLAKKRIENGERDDIFSLEPFYISPSEAERKRRNEEIVIREMKKDDIDEVYLIELESFKHPWRKEDFYLGISVRDSICLVAIEDGEISGYVMGMREGDAYHLLNIAVKKLRRKKGVGKALLFEFIKEAEMKNARRIILEVRISNIEAIELYKLFGFKIYEYIPNYYPDEDGIRMHLDL